MSLTQSLFYVMFGQHVFLDIYTENIGSYFSGRVNMSAAFAFSMVAEEWKNSLCTSALQHFSTSVLQYFRTSVLQHLSISAVSTRILIHTIFCYFKTIASFISMRKRVYSIIFSWNRAVTFPVTFLFIERRLYCKICFIRRYIVSDNSKLKRINHVDFFQ